jgi:hypothetical protein
LKRKPLYGSLPPHYAAEKKTRISGLKPFSRRVKTQIGLIATAIHLADEASGEGVYLQPKPTFSVTNHSRFDERLPNGF